MNYRSKVPTSKSYVKSNIFIHFSDVFQRRLVLKGVHLIRCRREDIWSSPLSIVENYKSLVIAVVELLSLHLVLFNLAWALKSIIKLNKYILSIIYNTKKVDII
jgi:hypothetical protein